MTKVVINGSFDVLHLGHIRLLEMARNYQDSQVYVLLDTDRRVKELKGADRPINSLEERVAIMSALKYVDQVSTFDTDEELMNKIKEFAPDIMLKGSDYRDKPIIGAEFCKEIVFFERLNDYSTTKKIQDTSDRR